MQLNSKKRVVITGMGVISTFGFNIKDFWENIKIGKNNFAKIKSFDVSKFEKKIGGEIQNFDVEAFFPGDNEVKKMGRAKQYALSSALDCLRDANIIDDSNRLKIYDNFRVGVVAGSTFGESPTLQNIVDNYLAKGIKEIPTDLYEDFQLSSVTQTVAAKFKLFGCNMMIPNACAAGLYSIGFAYNCLSKGAEDAMIAGGVDAFSRTGLAGFSRIGAITSEVPRPFSKNRSGMLPGEGAGFVFMETEESALKRNAKIYAEVVGYGQSCDANDITAPDCNGLSSAIVNALKTAHLTPSKISYISAHGTGTRVNDPVEVNGFTHVFGNILPKIPISSLKALTGHTMGAASAIETVASIMSIKNQYIIPTYNFVEKDPECDIDCVPNVGRAMPIDFVLKTALAFGGNNAALILRKYK